MLKNYFKIALRNLWQQKVYSAINILGLAVGIAVFILIITFGIYELRADKHYQNFNRIYRIEEPEKFAVSSITMMQQVLENVPEIEAGTRLLPIPGLLKREETNYEISIMAVDTTFFRFFEYEAVRGDPSRALREPNSIILVESFARKLFGKEDPLGKPLEFTQLQLTVRAVVKDPVRRTHISTREAFMAFENLRTLGLNFDDRYFANYDTYFLFPENTDQDFILQKTNDYFKSLQEIHGPSYWLYYLNPLRNVYFESGKYDHSWHGNLLTVKIFLAAAWLIIFIACLNFINLATARAILRSKEVGIRQVVGAQKKNLLTQFLLESVLTCLLAGIIAFILVELFYPLFADFYSINLELHQWSYFLSYLLGLGLLGLLTGLYPALYLSLVNTLNALKGHMSQGRGGALFRKIMMVIQFSISVILISGTFIVRDQLNYIKNMDQGYNKDLIINFRIPREVRRGKREIFREELLRVPGVVKLSYVYYNPGKVILQYGYTDSEGQNFRFRVLPTDPDFVDLYGLDIVAGRNFDWNIKTDSSAYLVNETFVQTLGWDDPVGHELYPGTTVIGVVKDFIHRSLHFELEPLLIPFDWSQTFHVNALLNTDNLNLTIAEIEKLYRKFEPEMDFTYNFLDEDFDLLYQADIRFGKVFSYFSLLAIFVACLGLFGLVSLMVTNRIQEVGIRKVLGASVKQVVLLLNRDFLLLVLAANIVAWPISWLIMKNWLQNFAFRSPIRLEAFLLSALVTFLLALATISFHTVRAAHVNPAKTLKYE